MKRKLIAGILGGVVCLLVVMSPAPAQQGNNGQSEVQIGFQIAPVKLDMAGKNPSLVGEGSYYVNSVSDCVGCHTGPKGHLSGGNDFGLAVTRNLTPDKTGKPAGLTLAQFKEALRIGTDFKNLDPP